MVDKGNIEYFERLNRELEENLSNIEILNFLKQYSNIEKLAKIIISYSEKIDKKDLNFEGTININDSLLIIGDFFKSINLDYYNKFMKAIKDDYPRNFFKKAKTEKCSSYVQKGGLHIEYNETIQDLFAIAHEYIHKFSCLYNNNNENDIKNFLGEVPTQTIELMLADFLKENQTIISEDINKYFRNDFLNIKDGAAAFLFYNRLIQLYITKKDEGKKLDYNVLGEELKKLDNNSIEYQFFYNNAGNYLDNLLKDGVKALSYDPRYIIGNIFGIDLHQQIKKDLSKINDLFTFVEILGHDNSNFNTDINMIANKLNIFSFNYKKFIIDEDIINRLSVNYETELKSLSDSKVIK